MYTHENIITIKIMNIHTTPQNFSSENVMAEVIDNLILWTNLNNTLQCVCVYVYVIVLYKSLYAISI